MILRYSQICACEHFVPSAHDKTICNSDFMINSSPFKYEEGEKTSEFDDKHFNQVFKESLPKKLNDEGSIDLNLETKIVNYINSLSKLNNKLKFQIYKFKKVSEDKFIFTLYRQNKDHAKVIEAKIVSSEKDEELKVIKELKVIGFQNSYDVEASILSLNEKGYDSLTFDSLEDRWKQKVDEKLIPDEFKEVSAAEDLNFAGLNP